MTVPTLMNCPHSPSGWCLACVQKLAHANPVTVGETGRKEQPDGVDDITLPSGEAFKAMGYVHENGLSVDFEVFQDFPTGERDLVLTGQVKWDGCSNWDHLALHCCKRKEALEVGQLLAELYELAGDYMPSHVDGLR